MLQQLTTPKFIVSVHDVSTDSTGYVALVTLPSGAVEPCLVYDTDASDAPAPESFHTAEEAEKFAEDCRPLFGAGGAYGPVPEFTVAEQTHERVVTDADGNPIFGRPNNRGSIDVFCTESGEPATRIDHDVYPVGSQFSVRNEHAEGITLTLEDAERIGLEIEYPPHARFNVVARGVTGGDHYAVQRGDDPDPCADDVWIEWGEPSNYPYFSTANRAMAESVADDLRLANPGTQISVAVYLNEAE